MNISRLFLAAMFLIIAASCDDEPAVQPQPTLTSLSITEGEGGASVTLTGTNFGTELNDVKVFFDGTQASHELMSPTQIVTTVPPNMTAGVAEIKVRVKTLETEAIEFNVLAPITVGINAFTATIDENSGNTFVVGTVVAATNRGAITYSLSNQSINALTINSTTGQITVSNTSLLDYEVLPNKFITATATATNGNASVSGSVTVNITDVQEVIVEDFVATLAENSTAFTSIGYVVANGVGGTGAGLTTTLVSQNPEGAITFNGNEIKVANAALFDFETNPTITGTYSVSYLSETRSATIMISLTDVDEVPETVLATTYSVFSGNETTTSCTNGTGSTIGFTSPYLGELDLTGDPDKLYISDLYCGARQLEIAGNGDLTATTILENKTTEFEYTDVVKMPDGVITLAAYRVGPNGNGNILVISGNNRINFFQNASFYRPSGIAVRTGDVSHVYVAERYAIRVFQYNGYTVGTLLSTYGQVSSPGTTDGPIASATFSDIRDVQVTDEGIIYVGDKTAVRKIDPTAGTVSTVANGFNDIYSISIMPNGNILVADTGNKKVRMIDAATSETFTLIEDLGDYPAIGVIAINNDSFYFTRQGRSAIYKASIDNGCNACR